MTTLDDAFDDVLDSKQEPEFADFLRTLRMAYAESADSRLPERSRLGIRAAITREAQAAVMPVDTQTITRRPVFLQRWLRAKPSDLHYGLLSAPVRFASVVCIALALAAGLFAYNATTTNNSTVSAASVLRIAAGYSVPPGSFAHFTYRVRVTYVPDWKGIIMCGGPTGRIQTSYSQAWVRGKEAGGPQAVIERDKPCDSGTWPGCPSVVIGRQLYKYPGACGGDSPARLADVMAVPNDWPSSALPSNLFYGPSAAHFLQQSLGSSTRITARTTVFQGRSVYELDVKNWPGDNPASDTALYFAAKTGLLTGVNFKNKYVTWRVRLVRQQFRDTKAAWTRSLARLPKWRVPADGIIDLSGFPQLSDFNRACPGDAPSSVPIPTPTPSATSGSTQTPTARSRNGLLGVCRKIHPLMTRSILAWRMLHPDMKRLWTAQRIGVFSAGQVRYSIAWEHSWLTRFIGKPSSLTIPREVIWGEGQ